MWDGEGAVWTGGAQELTRIHDGVVTPIIRAADTPSLRNICRLQTDKSGRVWCMTSRSGLQMVVDGRLENRNPIPTFEGASVRGFFQDSRGNFWAGTERGDLVRWGANETKIFKWGRDILDADVWSITEDASGNLWLAFPGEGVAQFDGERFKRIGPAAGLSSARPRTLMVDREGNVWVGSEDGGLNRLRRKVVHNLTARQGLPVFLGQNSLRG